MIDVSRTATLLAVFGQVGRDALGRRLHRFLTLVPVGGADVAVLLVELQGVENANRLRCRVRICKGAYQEPASVAFPDKRDVDENYIRCMHALMSDGNYPGIATHDERIIGDAKRFAAERGIASDRYEFQMLYGVRRDLQEQLVKAARLPAR